MAITNQEDCNTSLTKVSAERERERERETETREGTLPVQKRMGMHLYTLDRQEPASLNNNNNRNDGVLLLWCYLAA